MWRLFLELPVLSAHGAVLMDLLRLQPLDNAVHVKTVRALAPHWKQTVSAQFSHLIVRQRDNIISLNSQPGTVLSVINKKGTV